MSAFADVTGLIVTALSGLAGGRVYRGHAWPMEEAIDSEVFVRPEASSSERNSISGGPVDWRTSLSIEIRVRYTPDTQSADESVDSLLADVYAALATLGGDGIQDIVPATVIRWDYSAADLNIAGCSISVDVIHRTAAATLTAWT